MRAWEKSMDSSQDGYVLANTP